MDEDIQNTIEVLTARVKAKEDEANKLKKLVNELCGEAGIAIRYPAINDAGTVSSIRPDLFYGLPLTAAIRNYLELRKSSNMGAAAVTEIFRAIRDGGYKFDTKNEENARIGVGNALRKSSSIFHRLPNGQYGLLTWYPSARVPSDDDGSPTKRGRGRAEKKKKQGSKKQVVALLPPPKDDVTNKEVRDVVLSQSGEFLGADIEKILKEKYPTKFLSPTKVSTVLFRLKEKGLVRVTKARSGKTGATFGKA